MSSALTAGFFTTSATWEFQPLLSLLPKIVLLFLSYSNLGFSRGSDGKESACSVGDQGLIPGSGLSLEKEMATHSSILAWKIPWVKEPGKL